MSQPDLSSGLKRIGDAMAAVISAQVTQEAQARRIVAGIEGDES